jgi:hypothetical protein
MKGHCFTAGGDPAAARDIVYRVLTEQEFTVAQPTEWTAFAERGSSGKSILLGGFAGKKGRHVKLEITCQPGSAGSTITLLQGTSGASGGLLGVSQANKIYAGVYDAIAAAFQNAGISISGESLKK